MFQFLKDDGSPERQDAAGWEYHPPRPIGEAATPPYPDRPLRKRFGSAVVIARILINASGEVTDVSLQPGSTGGEFAPEFFHAVATTVRGWKFTPPQWWRLEEGKDIDGDGKADYQKVMEMKPTSASGDIAFFFEMAGTQAKARRK